jgi:uncharacterized protein YehS (DUF1456 family)
MIHNDVLRSLRYMLNLYDETVASLVQLGGGEVSTDEVRAYLARSEEPGYRECPDRVMECFLDGLIIQRRGPRDGAPPRPAQAAAVTNNTVLKKLRVAFEMREEDVAALLAAAGSPVSRPELSALFRSPNHPNHRPCGDQFLRYFLKSLTLRLRGAVPSVAD